MPNHNGLVNLTPPNGEKKVLVHCCCAPCSGYIIDTLLYSGIDLTLLFYNPNVHPQEEYELRKGHVIRYAKKKNVPFVDAGYDPQEWLKRIRGLEKAPERGLRCAMCFDMRLELTALYAHEHHFKVFATSCGIARWKNMDQVNACGEAVAAKYPGLTFWGHDWRKNSGSLMMYEISKREKFYKQEYCGCMFSMFAENTKRQQQGQDVIKPGENYY